MNEAEAKLRILLLTETYWPEIGGGETQARLLSQALARDGHDVTIVTRRSRANLPRREADGDVQVMRLGPTGAGRWRKWLQVLPAFVTLLTQRRRYDAVLVSGFRLLGIPAMFAHIFTHIPTVLKADSSGELSGEYFRNGLARARLRLQSPPVQGLLHARNALLRRADAFIALSDEIAQEFAALSVPDSAIHRIGNGVDTDRFRPARPDEQAALRARLKLPSGFIVVYTGRLVTYKGLPALLEAWRDLPSATLVLVGEQGNDMHGCEVQLREFVARYELYGNVRFTGAVHEVQDWLRAADAFVFPTQNEAFGLSLVEAMACGLPAVTTMVGGLRDFVTDGANALVVEPGDVPGIVNALRLLHADTGLRARVGEAARETAHRFAAPAIAERYVGLFREISVAARAGRAA